jgi:Xaa-Pro aminopeptidase
MKEGMTEYEVSFELEMYMRKQGASSVSFESIVASGENGAMPHARPGKRKLASGDLVVMDFGCVYNGYSSDMTRTVAVGDIDKQKLDVYNSVLSVQKECVKMSVPGAYCKDIHNYSFFKLDGLYKDCYGHGLGHGVGLEVHELPNLGPKSEYILTPGNVITVEPGVYIDGFCGVRIEDLVLITENGNEILSKSTKELIKIA